MAQIHRLVEVRADFEQTIVNQVIDQWSQQLGAFVKTKGQQFERWIFVNSCILLTNRMFKTTLIISEDRKNLHCGTCVNAR